MMTCSWNCILIQIRRMAQTIQKLFLRICWSNSLKMQIWKKHILICSSCCGSRIFHVLRTMLQAPIFWRNVFGKGRSMIAQTFLNRYRQTLVLVILQNFEHLTKNKTWYYLSGMCCAFNSKSALSQSAYSDLVKEMQGSPKIIEGENVRKIRTGLANGLTVWLDQHGDETSMGTVYDNYNGFKVWFYLFYTRKNESMRITTLLLRCPFLLVPPQNLC